MKLILTKLGCEFMPWQTEGLFKAWLAYNDIWIGEDRKDFELTYNNFYHFYDLRTFPVKNNGGYPKWEKIVELFQSEGYRVDDVGETFQWNCNEDGKPTTQRFGRRIWIYPTSDEDKANAT